MEAYSATPEPTTTTIRPWDEKSGELKEKYLHRKILVERNLYGITRKNSFIVLTPRARLIQRDTATRKKFPSKLSIMFIKVFVAQLNFSCFREFWGQIS